MLSKMRYCSLFFLFVFLTNLSLAQAISYRYIQPKRGHAQDFAKGLEAKTKKYNSKETDPKIYTFAVRASQRGNMQSYVRMSYGESLGDLPMGGGNQPGMMEYWMENVDKYIESTSSNEIFRLRESATHNDAVGTEKPFRRVIHYNIKHGQQDKFWKVRDNLPKAIEKAEVDFDINCFNSFAGGQRQHARIVIFGESLGSFSNGSNGWAKIRDAYNEIYGEDSWEIDWELSSSSLLDYGNSTELLEFIPELSSPPTSN